MARRAPELSCRQPAAWITDNQSFSVSESTVYRILRREGLVKSPEMQLKAGKEYHRKTTGPNQMWATDASYFKVIGWGYYYLVTVMDDFSRFILAHKLQRDMTADSSIEVVQEAVDRTGMTEIPVQDRTRLLSDNGSGYVSRAFRDYLRKRGIKVVSITEHADDSPTGKLMKAIIESVDEFYSENLAQEVVRGMREAASRGFFLGSKGPLRLQTCQGQ